MRLLVCRVGGLADTLSVLPTLDALTSGLCDAEITLLCAPRCAGLITMSMPGVRVISVDPALLSGPAAVLKVPALARQIGPLDVALIAPGESAAVYSLCRLSAPKRLGFACGLSKGERLLTKALPYDALRPVPDMLLDLARDFLEWPTMPLRRVEPLATPPVVADLGPEAWGGEEIPEGWDDDLPAEWGNLADCCGPVAQWGGAGGLSCSGQLAL
jgi:ADP-heptose:LPS heptosyltransferase